MDRPPTPMAGQVPRAPRAGSRSIDGIDAPGTESPRIGRDRPTVRDRAPGASSDGRPDGQDPARAAVDLASPPVPVPRREQGPGATALASAPTAANGHGRERASTKRQLSRSQTIRSDHEHDHEHDHEELAILADRERIAVDLNDLVIRRIFAAGLTLQSTAASAGDPELALRIRTAVDELDGVISDIRTTIFDLETRRGGR